MFSKKIPVDSITKHKPEVAAEPKVTIDPKVTTEPQVEELTILTDLPPKKPLIKKSYIIAFLVILAISALIFGGITISRNALKKKPLPSPTPLSSPIVDSLASPSPQASPSASPQPVIDLTDYKVQVLNGSGGNGFASAVKNTLLEEGFIDIDSNNAASFDYTATEISLKPDSPEQIFQIIDQALNTAYEVTRSAKLLAPDSDFDVVVIVGTKK